MTRMGFLLLGIIALFSLARLAQADEGQWTSLGPEDGQVQTLAIDPQNPQTLYAGTFAGGVFKSSDGGGTWQPINEGLREWGPLDVELLAVDPQTPQTLYMATGTTLASPGLFKSTNGGQNWGLASEDLQNLAVIALVIDPGAPQTLYIASHNNLYKSVDGGNEWQPVAQGLPTNAAFGDLLIDPQSSQTLYLITSVGLYKTINGGAQWNPTVPASLHVTLLAIDPQNSQILYGREGNDRLSKSVDGGGSWAPAETGLSGAAYITRLVIDPQTPQTLYGVTDSSGIFKSTNGGNNWQPARTGLPVSVPPTVPAQYLKIEAVVINPQNTQLLYLGINAPYDRGHKGGVYKSANGGGNWALSRQGLRNVLVADVDVNPHNPQTLYVINQEGMFFKSQDGGHNWQSLSTKLPNTFIYNLTLQPQTPQVLYAATSHGVFKSPDGGLTWTPARTGLPDGASAAVLAIDPQDPDKLYGAVFAGLNEVPERLYKSLDGGEHWLPASEGLPPYVQISTLAIDPANSETIYAGTLSGSGVFKSSDGGGHWTPSRTGLPASPPNSSVYARVHVLVIDPYKPETLYAGVGLGSSEGSGIYKSGDGGLSWHLAGTGLPANAVTKLVIDPRNPSTLYAGTFDIGSGYGNDGVYKSRNGGLTWAPMNTGLTNWYVGALALDPLDPRRLYAGTFGGGVFVIEQAAAPGSRFWFPVIRKGCTLAGC